MKEQDIKLFEKYKTTGYLTKVKDGTYIELDEHTGTAYKRNSNSISPYDTCEFDDNDIDDLWGVTKKKKDEDEIEFGEYVDKTYYKLKEKTGKGVVVGFVNVVTKGRLCPVWEDAVDVGVGIIPEKYYVSKETAETKRCAVVYYANNKKHLVPIENIETLEKEKDVQKSKKKNKGYERD